MSEYSWISEAVAGAASLVGTIGGGVGAMTLKRFSRAEDLAKKAYKIATRLDDSFTELKETFDQTKRGLTLELSNFEDDIRRKIRNIDDRDSERTPTRISRPDIFAVEDPPQPQLQQLADRIRQLNEKVKSLENIIDTFRRDLQSERSARHSLQANYMQNIQEQARQWQEQQRVLGQIEGQLMARK